MKNMTKTERLQARVEAAICRLRYNSFTADFLARTLQADKYDVLRVLHNLKTDHKVDQLTVGSDTWKLTPSMIYKHSPITAQPLAEAL